MIKSGTASNEADAALRVISGMNHAVLLSSLSVEAPENQITRARDFIKKRGEGIPFEYIFGQAEFFGMTLCVNENCLIPRDDTEFVCRIAAENMKKNACVADICTGSGCIALSMLRVGASSADAFDISAGALEIARKNALKYGFSGKTRFIQTDIFTEAIEKTLGMYDLIISNPPYIRTEDIDALPDEVKHEPRNALDGGDDGNIFYERLADICPSHLNEGGAIVFEIGYNQKEDIERICRERSLNCRVFNDYSANPRAALVTL